MAKARSIFYGQYSMARGILWPGLGVFYGQDKGYSMARAREYSMARARGILWPGQGVFYGQG